MDITWLGHACFLIRAGGYDIVLDPYTDVPGYRPLQESAQQVLCSHHHFDHDYLEGVTLLSATMENPFTVETMDTFHDDCEGALRGENRVHILRAEGLTVVHLGDLGHSLTKEQAARLHGCDALLLPVGGTYTIGPEEARQAAETIAPRVIVPMHYRRGGLGFAELAPLEEFMALYEPEQVHFLTGDTLTLTKNMEKQVAVPLYRA